MTYQRINLEFRENLAVIELNHPKVLNAISQLMLEELKSAVAKVAAPENGIRCLLLTGAGRGFCSGANLSDRAQIKEEKPVSGKAEIPFSLDNTYNPFFLMLRELKMPVVTAVQGPAARIGMTLALMGDIVLAGESAYFLQAFRKIGLIPDGGITWLLPRLIGLARAMELSLLAERLPAEKALAWGLINRVVPDDQLLPEAFRMAEALANGPTSTLGLIRQAYWKSFDNSYEQQLHLESLGQLQAAACEDAAEGIAAFLEKRSPDFKGR
ncbi:enoyl-CoA hydratase/isomerase [bacterium]|nr:enoyl-CoA hydratase/isomerase [bacterium]